MPTTHHADVDDRVDHGVDRHARAARIAGVGAAVAMLACLAASVLLDLGTDPDGLGAQVAPGWGWSYTLLGTVMTVMAALIVWREPRQWFGWALAAGGVAWATDGLAQSYVRYGIRPDHALPGMDAALWYLLRFGSFLPLTVALLLFLFPTGRFLSGRWGTIGRTASVAMALSCLLLILTPTAVADEVVLPPGVDMDAGTLPLPQAVTNVTIPATVVLSIGCLLVSMASVVIRYRRSRDQERTRMRWLLWSVLVMAISMLVWAPFGVPGDVVVFFQALLPSVAMTIGVVDPELVSIEDLLSRTLVYGLLAAAILAADMVVVAGLAWLLDDSLAQHQVVLAVMLVSVLLYGPLRQRLSRAVQRMVLGDRADPYDAVARLASALETTDEGPEQLAVVARSVAAAFGVGFVSVEVDRPSGERLRATHGERPAATRTLPITYRDAEVGRLVLPARGLRSRLSRRDEQLLGDLVRQAATAARTGHLAEQLQESRERLVTAREEERRRIRRDLHDGLGPALSGVVFQLESARLLVGRDPEQAARTITETRNHVQDVVADVRRLVHDLRPPALDDLGIAGALRQQADRLSVDELSIGVEADDLGPLPAAVEVAAYRIAAEALTNVVRHARAGRATVRLRREGRQLVLAVTDDGVGIPANAQAGVGLQSLRERAAELGGRSEVTCPPSGGTTVRAWLPLGPSTPEEHP